MAGSGLGKRGLRGRFVCVGGGDDLDQLSRRIGVVTLGNGRSARGRAGPRIIFVVREAGVDAESKEFGVDVFGWCVEDKFGTPAGRNGNVGLPGNAVDVAGATAERRAIDCDQTQLAPLSVEENAQIEIGVGAGVEDAPEFAARRPGTEDGHRIARDRARG